MKADETSHYKSAIKFQQSGETLRKFHEDLTAANRDSVASFRELIQNRVCVAILAGVLIATVVGLLTLSYAILFFGYAVTPSIGFMAEAAIYSFGIGVLCVIKVGFDTIWTGKVFNESIEEFQEAAENFAQHYPELESIRESYAAATNDATRDTLSLIFSEKLLELAKMDTEFVRQQFEFKTNVSH